MKKSILVAVTGLLILGLFVGGVSAIGGSGTESNPYTINSLADLKLLSGVGYASYVGQNKYFKLTSDIIADNTFNSIGNSSYQFNGHFDGDNHSIYNLQNSLFYSVYNAGEIKNINIKNAFVNDKNTGCLTGAFTFSTLDNCHFENCYLIGKTNCYRVSMIARDVNLRTEDVIKNCSVKHCTIYVNTNFNYSVVVGCLLPNCAGVNYSTYTYENMSSENNTIIVSAPSIGSDEGVYVGGILGNSSYASRPITLKNCTVKNVNYYISSAGSGSKNTHPFVNNYYINDNSTFSGVTTDANVYFRLLSGASLTNDSPQTAQKLTGETVMFTITGQQGAAVYLQNGQVKSGYNFGNYGGDGTQIGNNPFTASYSSAGTKNVTLILTSWNASSYATISGGTLTTTAYIKIPYTPTLRGSGTSSDPYQVGSNANLQEWGEHTDYYNNMYMIIVADFVPATTVSTFAGNLTGGNHTLTNARLPLFNTLGGTVNNLKFTNSIVNGNGILANTSSAAISNVTADDCFVGGSTTGGLVGNATGSFTDCTVNHITVKGSSTAGGIAGAGNTTVTRCKVLNSDLLAPTTYGVCA